jgi:hypothetical protein
MAIHVFGGRDFGQLIRGSGFSHFTSLISISPYTCTIHLGVHAIVSIEY